jgi:hypothetical protein
METIRSGVLFHEEQRFNQLWLRLIIGASSLLMIGLFGYGMFRQFVIGQPWGDRPMSDTSLAILGTIYILLGVALWVFFRTTRLITEVRYDALYVRFHPFHFRYKRFRFDEIEKFEAVDYRPIRDFGGWGIKFGPKGKAYNVSGKHGLYLTLRNGKHLMIGSQRTHELASALDSVMP